MVLGFIDIHSHILSGIDDGPEDMNEAIKMAEIAANDGISHIFATPHIIDGLYTNKTRQIRAAINNLKLFIPEELTLLFGADVRITPDIIERIRKEEIPTLNDSGYILIEFPHLFIPPSVDELILKLRKKEITPIITHPERHMQLMKNFSALQHLRDIGALLQITAMSITGEFGNDVRKSALSMFKKGLVDFVASDAHDSSRRPPILSKAFQEVEKQFGNDVAQRVFMDNPRKILDAGIHVSGV